jgi:hypothetical protein
VTKNLSEYYELSELCEDDIKVVCLLVQMESLELSRKTLNDLQNTKLDKYNFDRVLGLNLKTIRDLKCFFGENLNRFKIKEDLKIVGSDTNLMDFIKKGDEE